MLNMDGWGSEGKKPYYHGDPYTGMNRMYLKLKAELMPYLYSEGYKSASGLPSIRAMFLEFPEDPNTYGDMVKYQYMYGSNFLVAPVYEDVNMDEEGNDVRNNIYLPDEDQIWIDYFTGKQNKGGRILNGFDAPVWKLPLFVKKGAIVPMYEENNNPEAISDTNADGLDKTKRVVEFWPAGDPTKSVETTITVKGTETEDDLAALKDMLRNVIVKAESITELEMNVLAPKVQALIKDSYNVAVEVLKNTKATQAQYLEAWLNLANALHYADFKADKHDLNILIEVCNNLEEDYSAGFDVMRAVLEEAIAVNADENALQERINAAHTSLLNAYKALVKNTNTGIEILTKLVDVLGDIDGSKYCQNEAWNVFTKALNDVKVLLENENVSASQIHDAIFALTSAYENILAQLDAFMNKINYLDMDTYSAENVARFMTATSKACMMFDDPNTFDPAILAEIDELNTIIDKEQIVVPEDPKESDNTVIPDAPTTVEQSTDTSITDAPVVATGVATTGDSTNMMAILGLALASGAGVYITNKKRKEKK